MAQYEVKWTVKYLYTRSIEADNMGEALEISEDMGAEERTLRNITVSQMRAKRRNHNV